MPIPHASPNPTGRSAVRAGHADERELPIACLCVDRNNHATNTARRDGVFLDQSLGQIAEYEFLSTYSVAVRSGAHNIYSAPADRQLTLQCDLTALSAASGL
jgi:hypothetical protein